MAADPVAPPTTDEEWRRLRFEAPALFSAGPLDEERLFAGRTGQVTSLLETVLDRSKHAILFGERGTGKTSLSNVFWRRYGTTLQSIVAARVQADPSDTFSSLWIKGLEELRAFAIQSGRSDLVPIETDFSEVTPDIIRRELQKCRPNAIPILIIDEFDKLQDTRARELTANVIKSLHDYAVPATIILVGVAENVTQLIADHESIRRALTPIKLERMMNFELNEIIDTRLKLTPFSLDSAAREKIIRLSYGLPYYVHMLGKQAFKVAAQKKQLSISSETVNSAMDEFLEDTEQFYYDDYHNAVTSNQTDSQFKEVLLACAMANGNESGFFSATSVIQPLSRILGREVKHANFQRHLTEFMSEARGPILIRRGSERQRRYRFTDPMMQPYILMRGIREGLIPEEER
ncbi:AAA family ATPase [Bradyrhizobium sp. GCM10027634]|uniref:ATP-binding protein n=1 Tax=unclassified Bradyrhizobium TaxID=2631580 RepID=UPI00263BCBDA|nr:ATP-binding protein [Bradyrhizobium sp. WYCCWR 12677]MDN5003801.1 ATP-binding protein [Bradyrhizobium sp. WYCCWR 12677]